VDPPFCKQCSLQAINLEVLKYPDFGFLLDVVVSKASQKDIRTEQVRFNCILLSV
jgi:hypothetical protein